MLLSVKKLNKSFLVNDHSCLILDDLTFDINFKSVVSIYGPSGSGKTTLLNILSGLMSYDSGEIIFDGDNFNHNFDFVAMRKNKMGIVFQDHHLLTQFTAIENVMLPQIINGTSKLNAYKKACDLFDEFNISNRKDFYPSNLSGGEQQRIAILRSIVNNPKLILADEPTGNVDEKNKQKIFSLFEEIVDRYDSSILIVTHDNNIKQISNKILNLSEGKIKEKK
tara:strand:- start:319 stop:987 length:669 start_codon:yes stop_codon:yes gene_type:complete